MRQSEKLKLNKKVLHFSKLSPIILQFLKIVFWNLVPSISVLEKLHFEKIQSVKIALVRSFSVKSTLLKVFDSKSVFLNSIYFRLLLKSSITFFKLFCFLEFITRRAIIAREKTPQPANLIYCSICSAA